MWKCLINLMLLITYITCLQSHPQFWKLNTMSDKDLFLLDVKSTMSAGICYKQVQAKVSDPELRIRTVSYCCAGYKRSTLSPHSVKCDPICNENCSNGICSAPNACECYPGYARQGGRCENIYQ